MHTEVAASHGGVFALPYVLANPSSIAGYVAVAADISFLAKASGTSDVPLLTIYGSEDYSRLPDADR